MHILSILALILIVTIGQAAAEQVVFPLDYTFSGTNPAGSAPWLNITIDDSYGGLNTVRLFMNAVNLTGSEFISKLYLNFDPTLSVSSLTFTAIDNSGSAPTISTGTDSFKADGDGWYDIRFEYPTAGSSNRFTAGETVIYDITYSSAINASSFLFKSSPGGGQGVYEGAAHIQGIGADSGWVGNTTVVPEPISSTLFVIGGAVMAARSYLKRKRLTM